MKKIYFFLSILILSFSLTSKAQWVSGGTQVSFNADSNHRPFLASAAHGGFYMTWQTTMGSSNQIRTVAYDSNGNVMAGWLSGGVLADSSNDDYASQIITSEDGNPIVAWYGYLGSNTVSYIFVQKYSVTGAPLWNGGHPVQVSTGGASYNHKYPMIVSDGKKGVCLTWTRWDPAVDFSSQDVTMQRIDSAGNVAAGWNAAGINVAVKVNVAEYYPHIAITPDKSSIYVAYDTGYIGATSLIINKFNLSNGNIASGWTSSGVTVSTGPNVYPSINHDSWIYTDGSNNAVVVWIESRFSANGECYMQQVSPSGSQLLTAGGVLIAGNNANGIDYLEVKQESDWNLLISYNNLNTFNDVATMKVKPNASIIWNDTANTHGGYSAYPFPASDGNKGMFVFYVNTNTYIMYALGLDSTGALYATWTLPGVGFGAINNYDPFNPNYDQNGVGTNKKEAVVGWNRISGADYKIYTCYVRTDRSNCSNPTGIEEITSSNDKYIIYPNPSSNSIILEGSYVGTKEIIIYNMLGQAQMYSTRNGLQATLDISGLSSGLYFLSVNEINTGKKFVLKFVKN
jgi:hypothetical protein